jgi:hypothetical protein
MNWICVEPEKQCLISALARKISTKMVQRRVHLAARSDFACSPKISLGFRPESLMILKLASTLRVSFQCHLAATAESSNVNRECSAKASSGCVAADGGCSGNESNSPPRSFGSSSTSREISGEGVVGVSREISLFGNMRCWIQYEVPPTIIGIRLFLCASSICEA